ncbi:MAG: riboflavin synthase [Gammaproteobacteria bacterium]|nr:riboflavin synthase [Gammaproteobacteria bacterium]
MFTGIIQALGKIESREDMGGDYRLTIDSGELDLSAAGLGDSIAVNGVCLTATALDARRFTADVSRETLELTTIGSLQDGALVNLEPALTLSTPLGGHLVSGHIDGVGKLVSLTPEARSTRMVFEVPRSLRRYIVRKGSICIDGTSLTVNEVDGEKFGVNIVPHTLERTIMGSYAPETRVNIEVDLVARYLEKLVQDRD